MNAHPLTSALRELRDDFGQRNVWVALGAICLILGISGPFQTFAYLTPIWRIPYWTVVIISTFCIGSIISHVTEKGITSLHVALRLALSAICIGICVTAFIVGLNFLVFDVFPLHGPMLLTQFLIVTAISAVIEVGSHFLQTNGQANTPPPILARLPFEKRGELIALTVSDQYVAVTTTKGTEMILMRLSDAMREVGKTVGFQVHRSHWVAQEHIVRVDRNGDRAVLGLSIGDDIPVSRNYMPVIRRAGLLAGSPHA